VFSMSAVTHRPILL